MGRVSGDGRLAAGRLSATLIAAQAPRAGRASIASNLQTIVRDLHRRRARARRGLAVLEGIRLVEEALALEVAFRGAIASPELGRTGRGAALRDALVARGVTLETVETGSFDALADTDTPQGVIAVIEPHVWRLEDLTIDPGGAVLVLDGVQDPGNVGTLIRTAHALGASGTIALTGTADPFNPKALRGAMGSTLRHPVVQATHTELSQWLAAAGCELWLADAGGPPFEQARRPARLAVAFGNEGGGLSDAVRALTGERVAIPLSENAESLNVAVAAGILLYEVLRGQ